MSVCVEEGEKGGGERGGVVRTYIPSVRRPIQTREKERSQERRAVCVFV